MDGLGLTGFVSITSSSFFSLASPIRVFDLACVTSTAASSVVVWNCSAVGTTAGVYQPVLNAKAGGVVSSDKGWRFDNGFYCFLSGAGSAAVNYIREF